LPERPSDHDATGTREWRALVECASPFPDSSRLAEALGKNLDWKNFLALAEEHGLFPLVTARTQALGSDAVPADVRSRLQQRERGQVIFTLSLAAELFRILDRFASLGIEVLLTKGPALAARCYGDPGSRQYADLDFVVRGRNAERVTEAMIALGYDAKVSLEAIRADKFPGEYVFSQRGTKLLAEFHTERTFRYHPRPLPLDRLFERRALVRFDGRDVPALSVEDELILICIHAAKHYWTRLLWVSDVAALITQQHVDWDRALSAVREVSAERMLRIGLQLSAKVLGVHLPERIAGFVRADSGAAHVAARVVQRLPAGESATFGLFGRAVFRIRMRGGLLKGPAYLLRLLLSPTEEDWVSGAEEKRSWLLDAATRPFRLARKYGRNE